MKLFLVKAYCANSDLIDALFAIVSEYLKGINKIGIAFSGGIDKVYYSQ